MSRHDFMLPDLGEGIAEAEVTAWLVAPGQHVSVHDPIVEVQTDKAVMELPAPVSGTVVAMVAEVGDIVKVGSPLVGFATDDGDPAQTASPTPQAGPARDREPVSSVPHVEPPAPARSQPARPEPLPLPQTAPEAADRRPLAAPAVRQLARDLGVELADVAGTGTGGRILREDVEHAALPSTVQQAPAEQSPEAAGDEDAPVPHVPEEITRTPLRGLRRAIALKMSETHRVVPATSGMQEVDVTELAGYLEQVAPIAREHGVRLTWTAFWALATIQAIQEFPQFNASIDEERQEILLHRKIHLGVAVATDDGLVVPVVRDASSLSLLELAAEIVRVSEAARARTATRAELTGSTFTITNFGSLGGYFATPMVNYPEICIVGFGRVEPRPAVIGGEIAVRQMVPVSSTVDHRLIDGAVGAMFMASLRRRLERPQHLLLGVRRGDG
jgi:pyruvate dehydrogenase E2 component (dihydrolipoamide acetyltransferase)